MIKVKSDYALSMKLLIYSQRLAYSQFHEIIHDLNHGKYPCMTEQPPETQVQQQSHTHLESHSR